MIESIDLLRLLILVVATEAVTEILVEAKITNGLRAFIFLKAFPPTPEDSLKPLIGKWRWRFVHDLFSCGYCMSVWVAVVLAFLAPQWFSWSIVNWLVMVFVIHRASNFSHVLFSLIKKGRIRTYDIELTHKVTDGSTGQTGSTESLAD